MSRDLTIRRWHETDLPLLRPLLFCFLEETDGDVRATARSVDRLLLMGALAAEDGDPCLVATVDGAIVGYTFWLGFPTPLDTRGVICQAMGTYVVPAYRRQRIGLALRKAAADQAWRRGYTRIAGTAYTDENAASLVAAGFRPIGQLLALEVTWH
jgi:GNAT superfamily N-acetyltransferase